MIWNERIKSMRKSYGYTLKEIAKALGVTEATAQRYETDGIKTIPYEAIVKYSDLFACSPAYIMGWESGSPATLSENEIELLKKYRTAPEALRKAVRKLLDIPEKEEA